jgi:hypothetical protein
VTDYTRVERGLAAGRHSNLVYHGRDSFGAIKWAPMAFFPALKQLELKLIIPFLCVWIHISISHTPSWLKGYICISYLTTLPLE